MITLKDVEHRQTSYEGISYRKSFTATALFESPSVGEFNVAFEFTVERNPLTDHDIKLEVKGNYPYPLLNIRRPLMAWIGSNITL